MKQVSEQEWLASENPAALLEWVRLGNVAAGDDYPPNYAHCPVEVSDRKLRLFACACIRSRNGEGFPRASLAVEVAERFADGIRPTDEEKTRYGNWTHTSEGLQSMLRFINPDRHEGANVRAALLREIVGNPFRPVTLGVQTEGVRRLAAAHYEERAWDRLPFLADMLEEAGCEEAAILEHLRGRGLCRTCGGKGHRDVTRTDSGLSEANGYSGLTTYSMRDDCYVCNQYGKVTRPGWCVPRVPIQHVRGCWAIDMVLGKE